MRKTQSYQTRLVDFEEGKPSIPDDIIDHGDPTGRLWTKTIHDGEEWIVCEFDGTVFFAQIIDGAIYAHGQRASCRWCGGPIGIHGSKVFCEGACKTYQGRVSRDLNDYLRWGGARSYTLQREIAKIEHLEMDESNLPPPLYESNWSELEEFMN